MQDLRLIGVHEDGLHLILADAGGTRYRLPLDESLRAAARRDRPRLGQLQIEMDGGLRPKDVQAMIRGGLTAEETAERAGWTVEKVRRYEGPILAEREHVALLGRQVRLRSPVVGPSSTTLGSRVDERLRSRQIDAGTARWDSRRDANGRWTLVVFFNAGGRQRQGEWSFDLLARSVQACDDEARWLSADEEVRPEGPIPAPHLRDMRPTQVYDVEAEGGVGAAGHHRRGESIDLMAAMRERSSQRGRRRRPRPSDAASLDQIPGDALPLTPLSISVDEAAPPAVHPHPGDVATPKQQDTAVEAVDEDVPSDGAPPDGPPSDAPGSEAEAGDHGPEEVEPDARVTGRTGSAPTQGPPAQGSPAKSQPRRPKQSPARPPARKSGRPGVPSWDDIMFGKKSD